MAGLSVRRCLVLHGFCAVVTALAVLSGAVGARAEPSVAELEKQIDQAWNSLEPVIEKHNATRIELTTKRAEADELARRIQPLQQRVDEALGRVGDLAVMSYKNGSASTLNALLASGRRDILVEQLTALSHVARSQRQDIQGVLDAKQAYEDQKKPLDGLVAQLTTTEAQLAVRKKQIDEEIKRLDKLRLAAYGRGGTGELRPAPCPTSYPGGAAGKVVRFACAQIGKPYVWGAAGPGSYDCSGLTLHAWAQAGIRLPHNAAAQRSTVRSVSRSELRPGDLVFYFGDLHHIGMFVGGDWMVHAPQSGDQVRMAKINSMPVHSYGRPG